MRPFLPAATAALLAAMLAAAPADARVALLYHAANQPAQWDAFSQADSALKGLGSHNAAFAGRSIDFRPVSGTLEGTVAALQRNNSQPQWVAAPPVAPLEPAGIEVLPEPASWAMLILGFGTTGLIARRRRAKNFAQA